MFDGASFFQSFRRILLPNSTPIFIVRHKIRETLATQKKDETFSGTVSVDGAHFGRLC